MEMCELRDGTTVTLRELGSDDVDSLIRFFRSLAPEDRRYLRFDVTRKDLVLRRLEEAEAGRDYRAAAIVDDEIVGFCAILMHRESWQSHIGEMRLIVKPEYRGRRLGVAMIAHLVARAEQSGIERLVCKLAGPQTELRQALEQHGFAIDGVLPKQVKDNKGQLHSLVLMSCELSAAAQELREFYRNSDWPDG